MNNESLKWCIRKFAARVFPAKKAEFHQSKIFYEIFETGPAFHLDGFMV